MNKSKRSTPKKQKPAISTNADGPKGEPDRNIDLVGRILKEKDLFIQDLKREIQTLDKFYKEDISNARKYFDAWMESERQLTILRLKNLGVGPQGAEDFRPKSCKSCEHFDNCPYTDASTAANLVLLCPILCRRWLQNVDKHEPRANEIFNKAKTKLMVNCQHSIAANFKPFNN